MGPFQGRTALVTGGTKGIGRAIARDLSEAGFNVTITGRTEGDVNAVQEDLGGVERSILGVVSDVTDPESCAGAVERTVKNFGGLDVLVNNAGVGHFAPIQDMSLESWQAQIDTNLNGVFYMSRAAIPFLKGGNDSWILNIGSLAGRNTFGGGTAYNASKFGLLGMTEAMMLDLRYEGIRVTHIMPGSVDTGFGDRPAGQKEGWALTVDDVSRAVLDLLRYPGNALPSRIELRPSRPPRK